MSRNKEIWVAYYWIDSGNISSEPVRFYWSYVKGLYTDGFNYVFGPGQRSNSDYIMIALSNKQEVQDWIDEGFVP